MSFIDFINKYKTEIKEWVERHYMETPITKQDFIDFVRLDKELYTWAKKEVL